MTTCSCTPDEVGLIAGAAELDSAEGMDAVGLVEDSGSVLPILY